jgi:hypothetical protein
LNTEPEPVIVVVAIRLDLSSAASMSQTDYYLQKKRGRQQKKQTVIVSFHSSLSNQTPAGVRVICFLPYR